MSANIPGASQRMDLYLTHLSSMPPGLFDATGSIYDLNRVRVLVKGTFAGSTLTAMVV